MSKKTNLTQELKTYSKEYTPIVILVLTTKKYEMKDANDAAAQVNHYLESRVAAPAKPYQYLVKTAENITRALGCCNAKPEQVHFVVLFPGADTSKAALAALEKNFPGLKPHPLVSIPRDGPNKNEGRQVVCVHCFGGDKCECLKCKPAVPKKMVIMFRGDEPVVFM